jgi:molecular chaperone IbpA
VDAARVRKNKLAFKGEKIMYPTLARYEVANIEKFLNDVEKYSIGMDEWFHRFGSLHQTETNYPPYNLVKETNVDFRLEVALVGFSPKEVSVYTENNKLFVEGQKETNSETEYLHRGLATRAFNRSWTISDDVEIRDVKFENGMLTVKLGKIVPEHHRRKSWF